MIVLVVSIWGGHCSRLLLGGLKIAEIFSFMVLKGKRVKAKFARCLPCFWLLMAPVFLFRCLQTCPVFGIVGTGPFSVWMLMSVLTRDLISSYPNQMWPHPKLTTVSAQTGFPNKERYHEIGLQPVFGNTPGWSIIGDSVFQQCDIFDDQMQSLVISFFLLPKLKFFFFKDITINLSLWREILSTKSCCMNHQ